MFENIDIDENAAAEAVSTGHLPAPDLVAKAVGEAYERYRTLVDRV